jgi:creatinine amidohydrolase
MSMKRPNPDFAAMDEAQILAADTSNWIAVLPLGATEQHGPHLPLITDSLIAAGVVERLKSALPEKMFITFLPVEEIGYSPEHMDYPGSKSLAFGEAIERWVSIGVHLNSLGIRKLVLLNAHGGNSPLISIVATELRVRCDMLCVATSWTRFGLPKGMITEADAAIDIHGGEIETSVMLALDPALVDLSKAGSFSSQQSVFLAENEWLSAYGRHFFGWKIQDLNPLGVTGNASAASAEKGDLLLAHSIRCLGALLAEVDRFDLARFDRGAIPRG